LVEVWVSSIISGRRIWMLLTIAFLLVMLTPDFGLGWWRMQLKVVWEGSDLGSLQLCQNMSSSGLEQGSVHWVCWKISSLSLTCVIFIQRMLLMFWWMKDLSVWKWCSLIAQFSHPQRRMLMMYWMKTWCFNFSSMNWFWKKWCSLPISLIAFVILLSMSKSSVRSKEMYIPRYLKCAAGIVAVSLYYMKYWM